MERAKFREVPVAGGVLWGMANERRIVSGVDTKTEYRAVQQGSLVNGRSPPDGAGPDGFASGRYGASGRVPAAEAERPLSVQSGDLRADAGNGRGAPIPDLPAGRRWSIKFEEMG